MEVSPFGNAQWICSERFADREPVDVFHRYMQEKEIPLPDEDKNTHMLVRRTFTVTNCPQKAVLRLTADDYYKLYINGQFVGRGPAQGYRFCYYWNEYDVTSYLKEGENEIFADVYYSGYINRAYNSGDGCMGMIAALSAEDGVLLETDEHWEYTVSTAYTFTHMLGYDTCPAENYDCRYQPTDWKPCCVKKVDYRFSPSPVSSVQTYFRSPVSTERIAGGILYDFGTELTGSLCIAARGNDGAKIRILYGEELEDTPIRVRYNMRCNCVGDETWTLAQGDNLHEQYDYIAFRYVAVLPEDGVEIESVCVRVCHYPFDEEYCRLETDSPVLAQVWNICKNGVKYGTQEVYVDCPLREKGQYSGDMVITGSSQVLLTGDTAVLKKALDNQMQSVVVCKGLLAVTPGSTMQEIADYSLQFPIVALCYYRHSGDKAYLRKNLETCEGILSHFRAFARDDGLLECVNDKWNLVDWPDTMRDGYDFPLTNPIGKGCHNVINALYVGCVMLTERIRDILGIEGEKQSTALRAAFDRAFLDEKSGLYVDCEGSDHSSVHANIFPAYFGIHQPAQGDTIADFLVKKGMACGVYMSFFLLKALCKLGRHEAAYALITSKEKNSWYHMCEQGATTCFEVWDKDQKFNTSLCHPWASAPISVLIEDLAPHMADRFRIVYANNFRKS